MTLTMVSVSGRKDGIIRIACQAHHPGLINEACLLLHAARLRLLDSGKVFGEDEVLLEAVRNVYGQVDGAQHQYEIVSGLRRHFLSDDLHHMPDFERVRSHWAWHWHTG